MAETEGLNIYQRMLAITADMQTVAKNLLVPAGGGKYRAVSETDVLNAVKPLEIRHGVYSYPVERRTISVDVLETEERRKDYDTKQYETIKKTQFVYRIETRYRFVNVDFPNEYIDVVSYGDGIDSADKAPGKAMTYSDKYALLKAYKIQTGDDPDQDASPDYKNAKPAERNIKAAEKQSVLPPEQRRLQRVEPEQSEQAAGQAAGQDRELVAQIRQLYPGERIAKMLEFHNAGKLEDIPQEVLAKYVAVAMKKGAPDGK